MATMKTRTYWRFLPPLLIMAAYLLIALDRLQVLPPVHQDEPWIASVSYKLATEGVYGSDLFGAYHAMDRHYSLFLPTYVLLLSGVFKIFGVGLLQMRLLSVACGGCILALTWVVGRQIGGQLVGVLAMLGLACQRLAISDNQSGIPLADLARVTRYDIGVPVFGLLAFALYLRSLDRHDPARLSAAARRDYLLCGVAVGVAGLSHLYGAFWLPALLLAILARRGWLAFREAPAYLIVAGFALVWLPWLLYVAADWASYLRQTRLLAQRFDLLNPRFYLTNLLNEPTRYARMRLLGPGQNPLLRAGGWTALLGAPAAMLALLRRQPPDREGDRRAGARAALSIACCTHIALFALLLQPKTYSYLIAFWPLICIALAWGGVALWDWRRSLVLRGMLAALLAAIIIEGGTALYDVHRSARRLTPYDALEARLAAGIPADARVLGLHTYWLGLRDTTYSTWMLPFLAANPAYSREETLTMSQALEQIAPDVVIIDPEMDRYLKALADPANPQHQWGVAIAGYFADHQAISVREVVDPTYGRFYIYVLRQEGAGRPDSRPSPMR
jgi:4-amino-4-deoxy-L-arabinose transferase-like glycosyltransferase